MENGASQFRRAELATLVTEAVGGDCGEGEDNDEPELAYHSKLNHGGSSIKQNAANWRAVPPSDELP